jgi:IS1 family transposase
LEIAVSVICSEVSVFFNSTISALMIWLALDKKTREIVGVYLCNRSEDGARGLWNSLPPVYRQCAVCYTDFWAAYA